MYLVTFQCQRPEPLWNLPSVCVCVCLPDSCRDDVNSEITWQHTANLQQRIFVIYLTQTYKTNPPITAECEDMWSHAETGKKSAVCDSHRWKKTTWSSEQETPEQPPPPLPPPPPEHMIYDSWQQEHEDRRHDWTFSTAGTEAAVSAADLSPARQQPSILIGWASLSTRTTFNGTLQWTLVQTDCPDSSVWHMPSLTLVMMS